MFYANEPGKAACYPACNCSFSTCGFSPPPIVFLSLIAAETISATCMQDTLNRSCSARRTTSSDSHVNSGFRLLNLSCAGQFYISVSSSMKSLSILAALCSSRSFCSVTAGQNKTGATNESIGNDGLGRMMEISLYFSPFPGDYKASFTQTRNFIHSLKLSSFA